MVRTNYFRVATVLAAMMAAISIAVLLVGNSTASAQSTTNTITVNTTEDKTTPDDECSLREAIQNANDNAQTSSDCVAGSGEDTIVFEKDLSGTITLDPSLGPLTVTDSAELTIDGGQENITVSGADKIQVFSVSQGAKLAVENLTVADGSAGSGGGIENDGGTLTVTDSTFSANKAVGTVSSGQIDCQNACFGGGIENDGGTLTVTRSTFSGNESDAIGGGIANSNGTLTVANSTFSVNSAAFVGGAINNGGTLTVTYSTFSGNIGDGINNANAEGVKLALSNTILEKNVGGNVREVCAGGVCQGTITDGGYNISDDGSTSKYFTDPTSKSNTNPLLDPNGLQNNGGPTQTIALQPTSPAVNAIPATINGCATTITTDQRGVNRPQGPACDIGAFELTQASPPDKDNKHHKKHKKQHHHKKHKGDGGGGISQSSG